MGRVALAELARRSTLAAFGEPAIITHGSDTWTIGAVFSDAAVRQDSNGVLLDVAPRLSLALVDIDDTELDEDVDTVTVRDQTYIVREVRKDGVGGAVLMLRTST